MVDFKAVGISYHHAPLELRELVTLSEGEVHDFLIRLRDVLDINEGLVISTCNRTEIYYSSKQNHSSEIESLLGTFKSIENTLLAEHFRSIESKDSIKHLFEVSLGLDSKVLGDIQISNQVKRAYQSSADLEMAGPFLHRLMHTIFYANKRVVQETRLQDGNASVASVSVELMKRFLENVANPNIALIGLGEIGQHVLENLGDIDVPIKLVNRTKSTAEKLAVKSNVTVVDYQQKDEVIKTCDVLVVAVAGGSEIISKENLSSEKFQHKLIIDLSVPRSVTEEIREVSGLSLYNIDQLSEKTEKARKVREAAVPAAKQIIDDAIVGFDQWREEIGVSPTIQKFKKTLDDIRKGELAKHVGKVSDEEMELLEIVTKSMIQKVIKLPVIQLKAACKRGESDSLVGVLNDLFNLESNEVKKVK